MAIFLAAMRSQAGVQRLFEWIGRVIQLFRHRSGNGVEVAEGGTALGFENRREAGQAGTQRIDRDSQLVQGLDQFRGVFRQSLRPERSGGPVAYKDQANLALAVQLSLSILSQWL